MKSSGPVFTRQNPFQTTSRMGKSHYHPSCSKPLSKKKKNTTLSPVRSNQRPNSQQLCEKRDLPFATTDDQPVFTESWPSTDCGSSPASTPTSSDKEAPKASARGGKPTVSSELEDQQDSVLARYVERFRHGRPQSRGERQQLPLWWMSPSSLPPSSTPTKTTDKDDIQPLNPERHGPAVFSPAGLRQHDRSLSPCRGSLSFFSDTSQGEFDDIEILHLQERASRLLLRERENCEYTQSDGSFPVSSEGVGCSDFSSPVSADEPTRRPLITSVIKSAAVKASSDSVQAASCQRSSVIPALTPPAHPEEDILFQWRLSRKMEQARKGPQTLHHSGLHGATFSWQAPSLNRPSAGGQVYKLQQSTQPPELSLKVTHPHIAAPQPETKEAHGQSFPVSGPPPFPAFAVSGSTASHPQTVAHVPAHMHLLCDVLPCPVQSSHACTQPNISQSVGETHAKVVCKTVPVPGDSMNTFSNEPVCARMPSPSPSGAVDGEGPGHRERPDRKERKKREKEKAQTNELETTEKKGATSSRKQKKSARYAVEREHAGGPGSINRCPSHQRLPKKVMSWPGQQQQQQQQQGGSQGFSRESCMGNHAPPSSPIHSALGQVVSEVLFPAVSSPPEQRTSAPSFSPPCTTSAPPQASTPPCSQQNSVEVICQLLQEAEDSDEKECEDDPLLQVLRKQRKWIKEQISEVDSMLNRFQEEQKVT